MNRDRGWFIFSRVIIVVYIKMVQNYIRKTDRALIDEGAVASAVKEVIKGGSFRKTAEKYGLKKSMLHKRVKMAKKNMAPLPQISGSEDSGLSGDDEHFVTVVNAGVNKYQNRKVFNDEEEKLLLDYFMKASNLHYGLTYKQSRELAFQYAKALKKSNYPPVWNNNGMAGEDWILGFMKRHPKLSCRKPENTSLARDAAFNVVNVSHFFDNYIQILTKYNFTPDRIINIDETGIPTVMQHPRVIAPKGKKQVGAVASQERGENVTMCGIISASGMAIPPVFIFPRVNMKERFVDGSPPGSLGLAHKSGYMTSELFLKVLEHIKKYTTCSINRRLLILMDNHSSHVSLEAINFARDAGISLLSFPPHCSHRLQPLDVAVFGPFKGYMKVAMSDWMRSRPGRAITIADIAALCGKAFLLAFSPRNIISGFSTPGLWPVNRLALGEDVFQPSEVTDQPLPSSSEQSGTEPQEPQPGSSGIGRPLVEPQSRPTTPSDVILVSEQQPCQTTPLVQTIGPNRNPHKQCQTVQTKITPESCRPLQKAQRSKNTRTKKNLPSTPALLSKMNLQLKIVGRT